jgi:hypothetical protein
MGRAIDRSGVNDPAPQSVGLSCSLPTFGLPIKAKRVELVQSSARPHGWGHKKGPAEAGPERNHSGAFMRKRPDAPPGLGAGRGRPGPPCWRATGRDLPRRTGLGRVMTN